MAATSGVSRTGQKSVDGLLSGLRWKGGSVTWSLPDDRRDYAASHDEDLSDFAPLTRLQGKAAFFALQADGPARGFSVEGFTNLDTIFLKGGSGAGTITLANTSDPDTAIGYYPNSAPEGGDIFLGKAGRSPTPGNYDWTTILHEVGHALGLKHPHDKGGLGVMPSVYDAMAFSVMSYRSHPDQSFDSGYTNGRWDFAQTYMTRDIAALQAMYGADYTTNSGDTVYRWTPASGTTWINGKAAITPGANRIFLTIWDGGGEDTYDLSAYRHGTWIDLNPGEGSLMSMKQRAHLSDTTRANKTLYNALLHDGDTRSLVENVIGSAGKDCIVGNDAVNRLWAGAGNDTIFGGRGDDLLYGDTGTDNLDGGAGADRLYGGAQGDTLTGGSGDDILVGGPGRDLLFGGSGHDIFRFGTPLDTLPNSQDRIVGADGKVFDAPGAAAGDRIDVSALDADTTRDGNQSFRWGGTMGTGTGFLWVADEGDWIGLSGNTDIDAAPEFRVRIESFGLIAADFTREDFIL